MNGVREQRAWHFDVTAYSGQTALLYDTQWESTAGIATWDWLLDLRNVQVAGGSVILVKQAIQFAATRVDRPDDAILLGNGLSTPDLAHLSNTPASITQKAFWRRALAYSLSTAGTPPFARAQGVVYTSYRANGVVLPAEEFVVQPYNNTSAWSVFPLGGGRPLPCRAVDKARFVVTGQGNTSSTLEYWPFVRAFNDPLARGQWTIFAGNAQVPGNTDFDYNVGELSFPVTLANFQWFELAMGVRDTTANSARFVLRVLPSLKYV